MNGFVITVTYNDYENTINYLKSLIGINNKINIFIYDNNSNQFYKEKIRNFIKSLNTKNIKFIESQHNIGYFPAIRNVYDLFLKNEEFDYLIVSNNDILIKDKHFFEKLTLHLDKYHVIAPRIISLLNGKDQNPHREKPIKKIHKIAYKIYFSHAIIGFTCYYFRELLRFFEKKKNTSLKEREIYGAHGSFIIFTKKFFEQGGYIDNSNFLYGEEDTITGICIKNNMKIGFVPDLVVYHNEHKTTKDFGFNLKNYIYQRKAYLTVKKQFPFIYE